MLEPAIMAFAMCILPISQAPAGQNLSERIQADPTCIQFNDGCSICRIENGTAICSSPQIACLITGWVCVQRAARDEEPK
jgi:hypothetical protein